MNKELTKAEEQVMQALWKIEKGFANEIVAAVESDAAYNTVLTVVRVLEQKGFVAHETFNRSNRHYPLVSREEYMKQMLGGIAHRAQTGDFIKLTLRNWALAWSYSLFERGAGLRDGLQCVITRFKFGG